MIFSRIVYGLARRVTTFTHGLIALPVNLWYANSAGFRNNYGWTKQLHFFQQAFSGNLQSEYDSGAQSLRSNGFLRISPQLPRNLLENIRSRLDERLKDEACSVNSPNGATRFLINPTHEIPELKHLLSDRIVDQVCSYYGCALRVETVRVWRNHHVPSIDVDADDRISNTFHNDNLGVTGLRIFVYLSDGVNKDTGAFRFHDKPDTKKIIRSLGYFHRNMLTQAMRRRLRDESTLKYFEGDLGDVCICNTQECLHGASIPGKGHFRDILQFEVYPAEGPQKYADEVLADLRADHEILGMRT